LKSFGPVDIASGLLSTPLRAQPSAVDRRPAAHDE